MNKGLEELFLFLDTSEDEAVIKIFKKRKDEHLKLSEIKWQGDRELAKTLAKNVEKLLKKNNISPSELGGIIVYPGPGSFTGLRIGASFANAFSFSLKLPLFYAKKNGQSSFKKEMIILPKYSSAPKVTKPKNK